MSSAPKNNPWAVFDYEAQMVHGLSRFLNPQEMSKLSWAIRNAITESATLHTRILCELLLSRGKFSDDIRLTDLLPGIDPTIIAELNKAYGESSDQTSACWEFNKLLAHATTNRASWHNYADALNKVWPAMEKVVLAVAVKRPTAPPPKLGSADIP